MTTTIAQRVVIQQQQLRRRFGVKPAPPQPKTVRRFTVWGPSDLNPGYSTIEQLCTQVWSLVPPGVWDEIELLMKAGEGGSWQSAFDPHPLALSGPLSLSQHVVEAASFGVRITPYVVARGRSAWIADEQAMISRCVLAADRCVLNVEPGAPYWNGPNDPGFIRGYLAGAHVPASTLEVCMIPRFTQVAELGGPACIQAWTDPELVGSASWETYRLVADGPGPTSLRPDVAIPRLDGWGVPPGPEFRLCVVQRSDLGMWAETIWAAQGLQCWFLDGD